MLNSLHETPCRYKKNCIQNLNNHAEHKKQIIQEDKGLLKMLYCEIAGNIYSQQFFFNGKMMSITETKNSYSLWYEYIHICIQDSM